MFETKVGELAPRRNSYRLQKSRIEWTEATWNPVTGCTKVSPGCAHCYAETFAERWRGVKGHHYEQGFDMRLWPDRLEQPLRWRAPRRIFVNSMSDLFHPAVPDEYVERVFEVMARAERHIFQVLTKREERLAELASRLPWPPNVWMGVTIENRRFVHRADYLRRVPAGVRFISAEPLLTELTQLDLTGIDWLIAGGESGPGARRLDLNWVFDLAERCTTAGTAFFMKQLGTVLSKEMGVRGKGTDSDLFPAELRRRELPEPGTRLEPAFA
ncbi:MAG TPA: phage Gp37/Gp68 family protein [Gaiellaceae bacterium]|jgi:protein gp37